MSTVTLVYRVQADNHPLPSLATKVAGVNLFRGELDHMGMFVVSDTTAVDGSEVTRTIVLGTTAAGDEMWPSAAALAYPTVGLYTQALAMSIPAKVLADAPLATFVAATPLVVS